MFHRLILLAAVVSGSLFAQTSVYRIPDCIISFSLTATGTSPSTGGIDNRGTECVAWTMSYSNSGFSAVSLTFQAAPDNAGAPGTWATFSGSIVNSGTNPATSTTGATTWLIGQAAWIRMSATLTGSGILRGTLYGWKDPGAVSPAVTGTFTPSGTQDVNLIKVGGSAIAIGQAAMAASLPVVIASNQSAVPENLTQVGGDSVTLGAKTTANSFPVTLPTDAGTLPVQLVGDAAVLSGQQSVTGSAVALASNAAKFICVKANIGNTINVYVGPSGITTSTGMELAPGQGTCQAVTNTNLIFVIASTTGASVSWVATN